MVRISDLSEDLAEFLRDHEDPQMPGNPWTPAPAKQARRVAVVSSAGLKLPEDQAFGTESGDYRVIPQARAAEVVMDHISHSHDRSGFQQDLNCVFPLERLSDLVEEGEIGSLADYHYSFMGASDPRSMEAAARPLAQAMKADGVNCVLLFPV